MLDSDLAAVKESVRRAMIGLGGSPSAQDASSDAGPQSLPDPIPSSPGPTQADNQDDTSTDDTIHAEVITEEKYLSFESAFDFLCFFDPDINSGRVTLYPWQLEALDHFSNSRASKETPVEMAICAANGSGKDKYFIAPAAGWLLTCHPRSRFIATTASGGQLISQTEPYIRQLAANVNEVQGPGFIKIQQRHFTSEATGGEIKLFATDEGAKAEGFHPWTHDSKMALVINEAKSVLPEIFEALTRCTGYTHNIMISSPGAPVGDFYKYFTGPIPWARRVTAYECAHLTQSYIDKVALRYGKSSCLFRSMILAEFAALDSLVAIQQDWYDLCAKLAIPNEKLAAKLGRRAGVDLSMGGDESVISIWEGNRELALEPFRLKAAPEIADRVINTLLRWSVPSEMVNVDDGGIGRPIIDILWDKGYNVNRILNQSSAHDTKAFLNRGAELYFSLGRIMQAGVLLFQTDELRAQQLCNRNYKQSEALGKFCLQSKAEARASGQRSPDRGDATVLAFANLTIEDFTDIDNSIGDKRETVRSGIKIATEQKQSAGQIKFSEADQFNNPLAAYRAMLLGQTNGNANNRCYGSLARLFK